MSKLGTVFIFLSLFIQTLLLPKAFAYVAGSTSVPQGAIEAGLRAEFMRGLAGPESLPESQQRQTPNVNIYEVSGAYNAGSFSFFQDVKIRLTGTYFSSAAELLNSRLIYPKNEGWIFGGEVSTNFVHEPDKLFGMFLRTQVPVQMNLAKFVNPKIDTIGVGFQTGYKFSDSFGQESLVFIGSGATGDGFRQNASLSASVLGVWIMDPRWFPHGAALKIGPFFDGDLAERNDAQYATQGVRAFRLGAVIALNYSPTPALSFEASYIQKFTGTYFRATKDFIFSVRTVF